MLETTIRIVRPGARLYVATRRVAVTGHAVDAELLERVCGTLRHRSGLAAIPDPYAPGSVLVATTQPVSATHVEQDAWAVDIADSGEPTRHVMLTDPRAPELLPKLAERALLVTLARQTDLWSLDSPRIWYEPAPFLSDRGIDAYRRYEIGSVPMDELGVGLSADIGTAFFSRESLAFYFDPSVDLGEGDRRRRLFDELAARQEQQKGTLLYDNGQTRIKCYFASAPLGMTCATTGALKVRGRSYESVHDYYGQQFPGLKIAGSDQAVLVSFPGLGRPQPVAASRVRVRVANDDVPERLSSVDKIAPDERRGLLERFWKRLEPHPLGTVAPGLQEGFWCPDPAHTVAFSVPAVEVGRRERVLSPKALTADAYRTHYRQRLKALNAHGCYSAPPNMSRTLHYAYSVQADAPAARRAAHDVAAQLCRWTGRHISAEPIVYESIEDAVAKLRAAAHTGIVLFFLRDEPAAYHEVAYLLSEWRVKRVTERTLAAKYRNLIEGAWDGRVRPRDAKRGRSGWESFVELTALDVLQQADGVPFRVEGLGRYEAQLLIDVGHDRRHFAVGILVARDGGRAPSFQIASHVKPKPDHQHEAVNAVLLADEIVELVEAVMRRSRDPLCSLLVLRDGRLTDGEVTGIDRATARLVAGGWLATDARVDLVEVHKSSQKSVRFWERGADGRATNPLEGRGVRLNAKTIVLATTGSTLHQGTSDPILITGNGRCPDVVAATEGTFMSAQLNWSSPIVAQRLPLPLKRADEDLTARAAQEIRRLR